MLRYLVFMFILETPNTRGRQRHSTRRLNFVLSSHIDPTCDQRDVHCLSIFVHISNVLGISGTVPTYGIAEQGLHMYIHTYTYTYTCIYIYIHEHGAWEAPPYPELPHGGSRPWGLPGPLDGLRMACFWEVSQWVPGELKTRRNRFKNDLKKVKIYIMCVFVQKVRQ